MFSITARVIRDHDLSLSTHDNRPRVRGKVSGMHSKRTWWQVFSVSVFALVTISLSSVRAQNLPPPGAYQPIPNFTGVGAGLQFRESINDRFSGAQPIFPLLVGPSFANLPAEQDGLLVYCQDCKRATPCVNGGGGAWAVGTRGQWSCSTGALEASLNANGNKITSLANGTVAGDALSFGQTSGGDLAGSLPNPRVATVLGGQAPIYSGQTGALINTLVGAKSDGSNALTRFSVNGSLNAKAFGATGDGTTDDTVALQTAFSPCTSGSTSPNPNVYLPSGVYYHTIPLAYNCPNGDLGGALFSGTYGGTPGAPATRLTQNYDGPSIIMEAPASNNITLAAPIVGSAGNSYQVSAAASGTNNGIMLNLRDTPAMEWNGLASFTIEGFFKISSAPGQDAMFVASVGGTSAKPTSNPGSYTFQWLSNSFSGGASAYAIGVAGSAGDIAAIATIGGTTYHLVSSTVPTVNTVFYVVLQYDGSNIKLWMVAPGTALGTPAVTQAATGTLTQSLYEDIGMPGTSQAFHGGGVSGYSPNAFLESWRFSNSSRGYTNATTAPSANLANDSSTSLLLNFPAACASIGQASCSPDNMVEAVSGTRGVNVYLPVDGGNEGNALDGNSIHDLNLVGGPLWGNWNINSIWRNIDVSSPTEGFECFNNCFQTTWDHLHVENDGERVGFDMGNSAHDFTLNNLLADDAKVGLYSGGSNGSIVNFEMTDRGDIRLPVLLNGFAGKIDGQVLDIESANANYLTSDLIYQPWAPVVFVNSQFASLNNNADVYYESGYTTPGGLVFNGGGFFNGSGSTPSEAVHVYADSFGHSGIAPVFSGVMLPPGLLPADSTYLLSPCMGSVTLASGTGTFTASCIQSESACACVATNGDSCTATAGGGSAALAGTGTDTVNVSCQGGGRGPGQLFSQPVAIPTTAATYYLSPVGAGESTTEATEEIAAPATVTYTRISCSMTAASGSGDSDIFTLLDATTACSATPVTCTASNTVGCAAAGLSCPVTLGDSIVIKDVTTSVTSRNAMCIISP